MCTCVHTHANITYRVAICALRPDRALHASAAFTAHVLGGPVLNNNAPAHTFLRTVPRHLPVGVILQHPSALNECVQDLSRACGAFEHLAILNGSNDDAVSAVVEQVWRAC